jgi:hemoglobin
MKASLYDRLGGYNGISAIVTDTVDRHLVNPLIKARFAKSDIAKLKTTATLFFCAGGGGPQAYTGKDMLLAHRSMNISEQEFVAALDDTLAALDKNGVGAEERMEVLAILYSLKDQIVRV